VASNVLEALARANAAEQDKVETAALHIVNTRLGLLPHRGNRDEWPVFETWAKEKGLSARPARPATVAFFVLDHPALGIARLLAVVESVSAVHEGLADPASHPVVIAALNEISPSPPPPRSWAKAQWPAWSQLPRALQQYLAEREERRDLEMRRAQNECAEAKQALAILKESHGHPQTASEPAVA